MCGPLLALVFHCDSSAEAFPSALGGREGEHQRLFHLAQVGVEAAPTWVNFLPVLGPGAGI